MTIKKRFIIYFGAIFLIFGFFGYFSIRGTTTIEDYLKKNLPKAIEDVQKNSKLDVTAQLIRYDDEVLTQSIRNYAFTGDIKWKTRYDKYLPKLFLRIEEAIEANPEDRAIFESISGANDALFNLETEAFALIEKNDLAEAQKILDGEEYTKQKDIYAAGIEKYLARRGSELDSASATSTKSIDEAKDYLASLMVFQKWGMMGFVALFFFAMIFILSLIVKTFMVPLGMFKVAAKEITSGKLETNVSINSKDEIGSFAVDFNKMTASLKNSIENTEEKIKERTADLEKLNKYMTGRELKMIELKKEIADMKREIKSKKLK
ncbi:MAG: HAMP domain-containing protein [Candidatus Berkelbacteria bacterium]